MANDHQLKVKPSAYYSLIQDYPSGRKTMYISTQAENNVDIPNKEGLHLIWELVNHTTQSKYLRGGKWAGPGDLVTWDNRSTMHNAAEWTGNSEIVEDMTD